MTKEEVTSPTALTESVLLTGLYDAIEGRYVVTADLPNAFIQADINTKPGEPRTVLVIRGVLVDMLQKIAPDVYNKYVEYKKGKKVLYLVVNKAIYGMIKSPMLWYMKFCKDLESQGFKINPYDPCVANKRVKGTYLMVVWHVDDLKISHKRKQVVEDFVKWLDKTYSDKNGKVTVTRGTKHVYLGMILDYSTPGVLKVDMRDYVSNMLQEFRKDQKIGTPNHVSHGQISFSLSMKAARVYRKTKLNYSIHLQLSLCSCAREPGQIFNRPLLSSAPVSRSLQRKTGTSFTG